MFDINKQQWSSYIKNFNEDEFEEFCMRLSGYFQKAQGRGQKLTKNLVMRSFFILHEMQLEKSRMQKKKIDYDGIRHRAIIKYGDTIIKLKQEGRGAQAIAKYILIHHNLKVSKNTVQHFLDQQVFFHHNDEIIKLHIAHKSTEEIAAHLKRSFNASVSANAIKKYLDF